MKNCSTEVLQIKWYRSTAVQILFHRAWMPQFANVRLAFHNIHKTSLRFRTFTKLPFLNFWIHNMIFPTFLMQFFFFLRCLFYINWTLKSSKSLKDWSESLSSLDRMPLLFKFSVSGCPQGCIFTWLYILLVSACSNKLSRVNEGCYC